MSRLCSAESTMSELWFIALLVLCWLRIDSSLIKLCMTLTPVPVVLPALVTDFLPPPLSAAAAEFFLAPCRWAEAEFIAAVLIRWNPSALLFATWCYWITDPPSWLSMKLFYCNLFEKREPLCDERFVIPFVVSSLLEYCWPSDWFRATRLEWLTEFSPIRTLPPLRAVAFPDNGIIMAAFYPALLVL